MSYSFNPLTGSIEQVRHIIFYKKYVTVDTSLISTREIDLGVEPIEHSEKVFINGLILKDDCYIIVSNILTIDAGLDIRTGDNLDIRYAN